MRLSSRGRASSARPVGRGDALRSPGSPRGGRRYRATNGASAWKVSRFLAADERQRDHRRAADRALRPPPRAPTSVERPLLGGLQVRPLEDDVALGVEDLEGEAVEPLAEGRRRCGCRSTIESIGTSEPRSTSHHGFRVFSSVWVWPPAP